MNNLLARGNGHTYLPKIDGDDLGWFVIHVGLPIRHVCFKDTNDAGTLAITFYSDGMSD